MNTNTKDAKAPDVYDNRGFRWETLNPKNSTTPYVQADYKPKNAHALRGGLAKNLKGVDV